MASGGWPGSQGSKLTTNKWVPPVPRFWGPGIVQDPSSPRITPAKRRSVPQNAQPRPISCAEASVSQRLDSAHPRHRLITGFQPPQNRTTHGKLHLNAQGNIQISRIHLQIHRKNRAQPVHSKYLATVKHCKTNLSSLFSIIWHHVLSLNRVTNSLFVSTISLLPDL